MSDTLIEGAQLAFAIVSLLALLYLVVGLIRPSWAWAAKRRWVVLRSLAAVLLAGAGFVGVIAYTLGQPDSPHAFDNYLKDLPANEPDAAQHGQ